MPHPLIQRLMDLRDETGAIYDELMSLPRPPNGGERWDATIEYCNNRLIEIQKEVTEIKKKLEEYRNAR